jgi:hypothetical protein
MNENPRGCLSLPRSTSTVSISPCLEKNAEISRSPSGPMPPTNILRRSRACSVLYRGPEQAKHATRGPHRGGSGAERQATRGDTQSLLASPPSGAQPRDVIDSKADEARTRGGSRAPYCSFGESAVDFRVALCAWDPPDRSGPLARRSTTCHSPPSAMASPTRALTTSRIADACRYVRLVGAWSRDPPGGPRGACAPLRSSTDASVGWYDATASDEESPEELLRPGSR